MASIKTNAMRILDQMKIGYCEYTYSKDDDKIDGLSVSEKIGKDPKYVFKTLVAEGHSKEIYVFIVPVAEELDLKKAAKATGEKSIHMVHVKDIQKITGYIRGGCSPIGMKKRYKSFIDSAVNEIDKIIVSAGKIGIQIELATDDLVKAIDISIVDLVI